MRKNSKSTWFIKNKKFNKISQFNKSFNSQVVTEKSRNQSESKGIISDIRDMNKSGLNFNGAVFSKQGKWIAPTR